MMATELEFHEAANIFPMDDENIDSLAADIKANGQQVAIEIFEDKILDGRRRWTACRIADVEPELREVFPADPVAYVLSLNLHRRHLSETERAMVGARARKMFDEQARERQVSHLRKGADSPVVANLPERDEGGRSRDKAAEVVGVSGKSIDYATKVLRQGTPKLIAACDTNKIAVSTAAKMANEPPEDQDAFVDSAKGRATKTKRREEVVADESEPVAQPLSKGDEEAKKIIDEFNEKLEALTDGGVYTLESISKALECSVGIAIQFVRMCEVSPSVQVHRNYGRKGLTQYSFELTKCVDAANRIRQLAERIATDSGSSARAQSDARKILDLLGR